MVCAVRRHDVPKSRMSHIVRVQPQPEGNSFKDVSDDVISELTALHAQTVERFKQVSAKRRELRKERLEALARIRATIEDIATSELSAIKVYMVSSDQEGKHVIATPTDTASPFDKVTKTTIVDGEPTAIFVDRIQP